MFLLHRKSYASDKFNEFKGESDDLLSEHIKTLQLNQDGVSSRFDSFHQELARNNISVVYTRGVTAKWSNGKKISIFDGRSEIDDCFLIISHIHLGYSLKVVSYLHY